MTTTTLKKMVVAVATAALAACGGQKAPATLQAIQVTPPTPVVAKGLAVDLRAVAVYSDATTRDVTGDVAWTTSDPSVATVSGGHVTAVVQGTASIKATWQGLDGAAAIQVSDAQLMSIAVTAGDTGMPKGLTLQLKADGLFSDGTTADLTGQVTWSAADAKLAVVGIGLFAGVDVGASHAVAALAGVTGELALDVRDAALLGLRFAQSNVSVPVGLETRVALVADFSDGTSPDVTNDVTLASTADTIVQVAADKSLHGLAVGQAYVAATLGAQTAMVPVDVTPAQIVSMRIAPDAVSIVKGGSANVQAIALLTDGFEAPVTNRVTFSTTDATVAVGDNAVKGTVWAKAVGSTTLVATDPETGISASIPVTVTAPVLVGLAVSDSKVNLKNGASVTVAVTASYSDGSSEDVTSTISWYALSAGIVTVDATGTITGVGPGSTLLMVYDPNSFVAPAYIQVTVH